MLTMLVVALFVAGCAPKVDRRPLTEQEKSWKQYVEAYYPSWEPAPTVASGVQPNQTVSATTTPLIVTEQATQSEETEIVDIVFISEDITTEPDAQIETEIEPVLTENAQAESIEEVETVAEEVPEYSEYVVQKGDMLSLLAQKFYGRASLWTVIRDANQDVLKGKESLQIGMKLRIPKR